VEDLDEVMTLALRGAGLRLVTWCSTAKPRSKPQPAREAQLSLEDGRAPGDDPPGGFVFGSGDEPEPAQPFPRKDLSKPSDPGQRDSARHAGCSLLAISAANWPASAFRPRRRNPHRPTATRANKPMRATPGG